MSVVVNGKLEPLPEPPVVSALLQRLALRPPFALARNGEFIPRDQYAQCGLHPGDEIEIVHPAAGG
jgi:sulfur carrier protein